MVQMALGNSYRRGEPEPAVRNQPAMLLRDLREIEYLPSDGSQVRLARKGWRICASPFLPSDPNSLTH